VEASIIVHGSSRICPPAPGGAPHTEIVKGVGLSSTGCMVPDVNPTAGSDALGAGLAVVARRLNYHGGQASGRRLARPVRML
jgi:hypothetical protein